MKYGNLPKIIAGNVDPVLDEVLYCLYMPVSLPGSTTCTLPPHLEPFRDMLDIIYHDDRMLWHLSYVYITVKRQYVGPNISANRPGWHSDGFGTNDINYLWYDSLPTLFNDSEFNVTEDHIKSLEEFEEQALSENNKTYPCKTLLKLDPSVVHRVQLASHDHMRTFVKVSLSFNRYNLKGNSRNHYLDGTDWVMYDREEIRNDPAKAQTDYK